MLQLGRGSGRLWPPALLNAVPCGWLLLLLPLLLPLPLPADDVLASSASIRAKLSGPASVCAPCCSLLAAVLGLLDRWLLPAPLLLLNLITKADRPAGADTRLLLLLNSADGGPDPAAAGLPAVGPVLQRFWAEQPPLPLLLAPSPFI
jgi:hypothetical protein